MEETKVQAFGIGDAVAHLRAGRRVARAGWNGKGMWLVLVNGSDHTPEGWVTGIPETHKAYTDLVATCPKRLPFVAMKTAGNELVPWLCSQTDLLATDWQGMD